MQSTADQDRSSTTRRGLWRSI